MNTLLFVCLASLVGYSAAYPNHAECRVFYTIPLDCAAVKSKLSNTAMDWDDKEECPGRCEKVTKRGGPPLTEVTYEGTRNPCRSCPCGQKCLYQVDPVEAEANTLTGYHLTPVFKYRDNFTFAFTDGDDGVSCNVEGFSTSTVSYAYFDYGTNYCNLRNLMDGAGISGLDGFSEDTNQDICMQLDKINCAKY